MSSPDNTGLGLFDDTASAVGNFPSALRGYDRQAVDDYVRSLEGGVVQLRRQAAELTQQVATLQDQLSDSEGKQTTPEDIDYANLGGRASDILRLAQEQARDLTENATAQSERIKEQARREAEALRDQAGRDGDSIKTGGVAEIERLRAQLATQVRDQVDKAKAEAEALVAAGRREGDALRRQAEHDAQTVRQNAYLDTENLRRGVDREVADARQAVAVEREAALAQLKAAHDEANEKTSSLLAEATQHHTESSSRLEADIAEAARVRAEAVAEAQQVKLAAVQEAEERIATAKKQATSIGDRTQQEFAWRKQQLRRETELLGQRKQAVLSQLASLSALAQQTAQTFPDFDDTTEPSMEPDGDQTVLRPAAAGPAGPRQGGGPTPKAGPVGAESDELKASSGAATQEPPVDGDATVLMAPGDAPAGTAHLNESARSND